MVEGNHKPDPEVHQGFRLSWRIENPPLELTMTEVGKGVVSPSMGANSSYGLEGVFKASLLIPETISEEVGSGRLVVQLEVAAREEGVQEEIMYSTASWGKPKYSYYEKKRTWADAEAHCQREGGHLASVLSQEEHEEMMIAFGSYSAIWLGGNDQEEEGRWCWSDGAPWNYTKWQFKNGRQANPNGKTRENCLKLGLWDNVWSWADRPCRDGLPYICKADLRSVPENTSLILKYTKEQLVFSKFQVWFQYKYSSGELVDSLKSSRIAPFELTWFIQDSNGSRLTPNMKETPAHWKPAENADPMYLEP